MTNEFRSKLDDIFDVKEYDFKLPSAFGKYRELFPDEAVTHPAKAYTDVLEYLIKTYTKPGDLILDPMAGTYSTCVVATLHGRNCIGVDIEERFYKWGLQAKKKVEKARTLLPKGKMIVLKGDARQLTQLLQKHKQGIDNIIFSPPYAESVNAPNALQRRIERLRKKGYDVKEYVGGKARCCQIDWTYSKVNPDNIGRLKYGDVDAIITSPPCFDSDDSDSSYTKYNKGGKTRYLDIKLDGKAAIKNYGNIDAIITSPPYSGTISKNAGGSVQLKVRVGKSTLTARCYSESERNIGNLPHGEVDAVITSPPYEEIMSEKRHHTPSTGRVEKLLKEKSLGTYYKTDSRNIGNIKGETYIEAMLKVYSECFKVLKKGGKIIVIIKPFIRNKKVIDLPYHTYLMLRKVGFKIIEVLKYKLKRQSFWRILYYRRFPSVPRINHEYVIVGIK
ncbi:MAG: hypothetical protein DRJ60_00060 [Thermoprotei archaeon]|nr:MAG: hypothetical protein DRJ60_00060 [Thermoprotei archaeon]